MDPPSDSDSDGSHISSTPPRHPSPMPLHHNHPPPPPPSHHKLLHLLSIPKSKPNFTSSRPILKFKPSAKKPKLNPQPEPEIHQPDPIHSPPVSFSCNIVKSRSYDPPHNNSNNNNNSIDICVSSCLPKTTSSFAKYRNRNLDFEPTENVIENLPENVTEGNVDVVNETSLLRNVGDVKVVGVRNRIDLIGSSVGTTREVKKPNVVENLPEDVPQGNVDVVNETSLLRYVGDVKVVGVRNRIDLIGRSVGTTEQVKKPKVGVNEGNFVKLNINGHGGRKKFAYKVRKKNQNAYNGNPRSYRRSKKKLKSVGEADDEEKSLCDEEGEVEGMEFEGNEMRVDKEMIERVVNDVRRDLCDENLVKLLKVIHGYDSFRDGQLDVIKMILDGKSSMVILPTGAGKSLCYQLPALVLEGMTLVISPLVALMFDQLKQLPPVIPGGLLCSSQTLEESSETLRRVQEGSLKVLFISPERLLNAGFTSIFAGTSLISLVVIDEAHCISEWSHNFRPSYMRLRASLLRSSLGVDCFLAMTATATTKTMNDVMCSLEIPYTNLVQAAQVRDNLQLSVSLSGHRMKDLMALLKAPPYTEIKSIIIYCKYQSETDMISKFLRDSNIRAKSYHSGIPAKERRRTQELFCSNKIRAIVATVAFGMGLDKGDVGAVIHYSLPESLEEYVQEIGRAGRDGRLSYCHLLFDDTTYFKLRSLMYSDGLDQYTVNKFLSHVFAGDSLSQGKICSLVKESASRKFDMKEEVILTILTRLELAEVQYLHLLPQTSVTCVLNFHMTSPALLAAKDIVIAAILKKSEIKDGQYVFDIPTVAFSIGAQAFTVTNQLQILKSKGEITYELKDLAYCYTIINFPKDICSLAADLAKWLSEVESCQVRKVDAMFDAALFAVKTCDRKSGCTGSQHTPCLQKKILDYFNAENDDNISNTMGQTSRFLRADIKVFLQSNSHAKFTPRAIARIMHGIASPAFPSSIWSKTHFWGRYMQTNFDVIMEAAKAELMDCVGKSAV